MTAVDLQTAEYADLEREHLVQQIKSARSARIWTVVSALGTLSFGVAFLIGALRKPRST